MIEMQISLVAPNRTYARIRCLYKTHKYVLRSNKGKRSSATHSVEQNYIWKSWRTIRKNETKQNQKCGRKKTRSPKYCLTNRKWIPNCRNSVYITKWSLHWACSMNWNASCDWNWYAGLNNMPTHPIVILISELNNTFFHLNDVWMQMIHEISFNICLCLFSPFFLSV